MSSGLIDPAPRPYRLLMNADAVGGVWQYAVDLARALQPHGVETTLAVLGPAPAPDQVAEAAAVPGLTLVETRLPLDWTAADQGQVEAASLAMVRLAERLQPDLVHLNSPTLAVAGPFPAPVVAACHSCVATWWEAVRGGPLPEEFVWRTRLNARGLHAASALIAPTEGFAAAITRAYGLGQAPAVVRNGRLPAPASRREPPAEPPFAFAAGRLWDEGKGLAILDRAAAMLRHPILAAGPLAGPNGARVALDHVRALGRLDDETMAAWFAAAPVFVSTALYEPFGLAVLEAAQAGCALVLSDIPTLRELWDGAALFVPPRDEGATAAAIEAALTDRSLRESLSAAARGRAARYTVEAMAAGVLAVHQACLRAEPRAPQDHAA